MMVIVRFKFICDAMLGALARHLRFFGFDTLYVGEMERSTGVQVMDGSKPEHPLDDGEILCIARKLGRFVLTKDEGFARRDPERVVHVTGLNLKDYLILLKERFDISFNFDQNNSRCYRCNIVLQPVTKESVKGKVKEKTFIHYDTFFQCPDCMQVFWVGAHFTEQKGLLNKFDELLDE